MEKEHGRTNRSECSTEIKKHEYITQSDSNTLTRPIIKLQGLARDAPTRLEFQGNLLSLWVL